jgi:hypothetical protein
VARATCVAALGLALLLTSTPPPALGTTEAPPTTTTEAQPDSAAPVADADRKRPRARKPVRTSFRAATINVLGSSHTDRKRSPYASGVKRIGNLVTILKSRGLPVAGLQEFQPDQRAAFAKAAPGWAMYPGGDSWDVGTTSVVWRTKRFARVQARLTPMPFYEGKNRPAPSVLLRERKTGMRFWFSTFHLPRDTGKSVKAQRQRKVGTQRQIALVGELSKTRIPHILTGDMNERESWFCRFTRGTNMHTPVGGSNRGRCKPPARSGIDWIFGSGRLDWSGFTVDTSRLVRRTTDHAVRYAFASFNSKDFENSLSRR